MEKLHTHDTLLHTPLTALHESLNARLVPFAGYLMPVQFEGIVKEHQWTREHAGIFDVSHMGQLMLSGATAADWLSSLTPYNFNNQKIGTCRYTVLLNKDGGMIDDFIVSRLAHDRFYLVVNAGCFEKDKAWLEKHLPHGLNLTHMKQQGLIALQGPEAFTVLNTLFPQTDWHAEKPMHIVETTYNGTPCLIATTGYTGEKGCEISLPEKELIELWKRLLKDERVKPIGLGARDSLRLDVGFPLYGHDIDETTSPMEASLGWIIDKEHKGYIGEDRLQKDEANGTMRKRVGIQLLDKGIAREGTAIFSTDEREIGVLTSGGFSPTLERPIAQGYIARTFSKAGTPILLDVRGKKLKAVVCGLNHIKQA